MFVFASPKPNSTPGLDQLTGDVTAGPGTGSQVATLAAVGAAGVFGDAAHTDVITTDSKGRVSSIVSTLISITVAQISNLAATLAGYLLLSGGTMTGPIVGLEDKGSMEFFVGAYGALPDAGATDAVVGIQDAINAASAAGGGRVTSKGGTYTCKTAPQSGPSASPYCLIVPSNVTLEMNPGATLTIANGLNAGVVLLTTNATLLNVGRFIIDGNKANQVDGGVDGAQCGIYGSSLTYFDVTPTAQNCIRQGIYISNSSWGTGNCRVIANGTAVNVCSGFEDDANNFSPFNVLALNNLGVGFRSVGGASLLDNKVIATVIAYGNQYGVQGFYKQGARFQVIAQGNTDHGVFLENCADCVVDGYYDTNTQDGVYDYLGTRNTIRGTARNNGRNSFNVYGSTSTLIDSPQESGGGASALTVDATSVGTKMSGGRITGVVANASPSTVIRNVAGFNPVGSAVPGTAFAIGASTVAATNNTGVDGALYCTAAGTVTAVSVNGVAVSTVMAVGDTFRLAAHATFTLTYTVAPTLVFVGE